LGWSIEELRARSGLSARTISTCESGDEIPLVSVRTLRKLVQAFRSAGVEFTQDVESTGVRILRRR
jgi:transcriptional regulator with XRE-family HTH domain